MRLFELTVAACLTSAALSSAACSGADETTATKRAGTTGGAGGATSSATAGGSGPTDAGPDADNGMPSDVYPAPHPAAPRVVWLGGPVLKAPSIYPVFFSNDDAAFTAEIADFVSKVGQTVYWAANVQEYGVGAATGQPPIQLAEAAPTTIDDPGIQTWLAGKLNADDPTFPSPDDNTVIALVYPAGTTITQTSGGQTALSCQDFGGYHNSVTLDAAHGARDVAYAVLPRCADFLGLNVLDGVTAAGSHEFIEAATDPYPMVDPAYGQVDQAHLYWLFALGGGETADMCAQSLSSFTKFSELAYTVQRSWSNESAAASHDPCVPNVPGEAYFNSVPLLPDDLSLGNGFNVKGVKIAVGETKTVDLVLFSDAATNGPWTVEARDFAEVMGQQPELSFSFDRTSGVNGEKLHLSVTVLRASPYGAELFYLTSHSTSGRETLWVGIVGN